MKGHNSGIVWRGASRFDGAPIVAIVTSLDGSTQNPKTGPMAQLWILRADVSPSEAVQTDQDGAICGSCAFRGPFGRRACYVVVPNAPQSVYRQFLRGGYPELTPRQAADLARARGLAIRLGAYGDPAALPVHVLRELTIGVYSTGYTHAWRTSPAYRPFLMASVDSPAELERARAAGWRTFRTRLESEPLAEREIMCPASDEAGHRTTCQDCTLCDGRRPEDRRASVAILAHGFGARQYIALRQVHA